MERWNFKVLRGADALHHILSKQSPSPSPLASLLNFRTWLQEEWLTRPRRVISAARRVRSLQKVLAASDEGAAKVFPGEDNKAREPIDDKAQQGSTQRNGSSGECCPIALEDGANDGHLYKCESSGSTRSLPQQSQARRLRQAEDELEETCRRKARHRKREGWLTEKRANLILREHFPECIILKDVCLSHHNRRLAQLDYVVVRKSASSDEVAQIVTAFEVKKQMNDIAPTFLKYQKLFSGLLDAGTRISEFRCIHHDQVTSDTVVFTRRSLREWNKELVQASTWSEPRAYFLRPMGFITTGEGGLASGINSNVLTLIQRELLNPKNARLLDNQLDRADEDRVLVQQLFDRVRAAVAHEDSLSSEDLFEIYAGRREWSENIFLMLRSEPTLTSTDARESRRHRSGQVGL
uniref:Uncharacterized protein n=1 Tax=Compsopogon caeruleus TaxID=31354 RepID=A0A7S1THN8_9RHOD|mmetsp:Transcript_6783/g.13838  ORF Transcript_6783/g.13838 Transcript_6783/m.13838 type:complete len:409 (+) Transcript_6783:95-1321(+)